MHFCWSTSSPSTRSTPEAAASRCSFGTLLSFNTYTHAHAHTCTLIRREVNGINLIPRKMTFHFSPMQLPLLLKNTVLPTERNLPLSTFDYQCFETHFLPLISRPRESKLPLSRQISRGANTPVTSYPAKSAGLRIAVQRPFPLPFEYPKAKESRNSPPRSERQRAYFLSCEKS